jgi:dTDP-4-amino-4,6-dideoxygalactose transaminase
MIMPVDFGGVPCDYDGIKEVLKAKNREDIIILCDSAHSFGGKYKGEVVGGQCDFHTFSFHAVKNITTSEGGAITYNEDVIIGKKDLYRELKITSLQGQTKDALSKTKAGAWEYDIITDGLKCNMTDISAAIGLVQLKRYPDMLGKRKKIFNVYTSLLKNYDWAIVPFEKDDLGTETSYHLYPLRIRGFKEDKRNKLIEKLAKKGIATNVHFKPLPLFTLYKNLGYKIEDYPNAFSQYENEISLPIYSSLSVEDAYYVAEELIKSI